MSLTRREIAEQPEAVARVLDRAGEALAGAAAELRRGGSVAIVGRGSSANAGLYAQHVFGRRGLATTRLQPSLQTLYEAPPRLDGALVIAVSQSGRSPDVVEVVAEAAGRGRPTLAITNDPGSPLARQARYSFDLGTGPESAVAATKTYTASLAALAALAALAGGERRDWDELRAVPERMARALAGAGRAAELAEREREAEAWVFGGRGPNLASAAEAALKLLELTGRPAVGLSHAELLHGPIAMLRPGRAYLAIAVAGPALPSARAALRAAAGRGAALAAITDAPALLDSSAATIPLEPGPEWLSPLPAAVAAQLLAVELSEALGVDTDAPFGLNKVTMTR